jgi:hypothetical protein
MRAIAPSQHPPDCRDMKSQIMLEEKFLSAAAVYGPDHGSAGIL